MIGPREQLEAQTNRVERSVGNLQSSGFVNERITEFSQTYKFEASLDYPGKILDHNTAFLKMVDNVNQCLGEPDRMPH